SAGARNGPNRAPAKSARSTAARAGSTVGLRASRASRTYGSTPSKPRGRVRGFCARDGTRESASQDECMKTSRLDPETVRASTVLPRNQGRTESPLLRSGEVFQQTARASSGEVETGFPKRSCSTEKLERQSIQSEAIALRACNHKSRTDFPFSGETRT